MQHIPVNSLPQQAQLLHTEPLEDEMPYDFRKPHRHDYFECFLFREGGGTHYIDFRAYPITAESVHFVFPGQVHLMRRRGARGQVIVCRKELLAALPHGLFSGLQNRFYQAPCVYFDTDGFGTLSATESRLRDELEQPDALSPALVQSYLHQLLAACIRRCDQSPGAGSGIGRHLEQYHRFCALMDECAVDARLPVSYFAKRLGVSTKVLNEHIRQASGKTCIALLQDRLLTEAKRSLLYTDDSCKEIAYALGFQDTSYFGRFFKKLEGRTPMRFKLHWAEKYQHPS